MFAVLHLPQFALQAALRHSPELWSRPIALVDPALTTPRVCDLTAPARRQGVETGLTPTQALARCGDVSIRHRSPAQEAAATDAVLQCAYGFSPNIENTAPGTVTLDLRGLSELAGRRTPARHDEPPAAALRNWATRLHTALASLNLTARIGVGPTPNIARHAAYWGNAITLPPPGRGTEARDPKISETGTDVLHEPRPRGHRRKEAQTHRADQEQSSVASAATVHGFNPVQIVTDPAAFIASLPVAALDPSTDVADILAKWGIRTVGGLLALGQDAVMDRLGLEAIALFAAASANTTRPLNLVRPAEHYGESFDFEHEIETIEPLLFILNRFVTQISQRLELGMLAAELLTLRLRLASGETIERRLRVPQPTRRADILFRTLQTHLESLRTESPIAGVALQADPTQPDQKQFSLFEAALRDPHQFQETLARLSALVGADRVGSPVRENSHRPDAFKLIPPDFENAPTVLRQRVAEMLRQTPLRRFRPAVKATVEQESAKPQAPRSRENPRTKFHGGDVARGPGNIVELLGPLFSKPMAANGNEREIFATAPDALTPHEPRPGVKPKLTNSEKSSGRKPSGSVFEFLSLGLIPRPWRGFMGREQVQKEQAAFHEPSARSSRREEAQTPRAKANQSLVTSAATVQEFTAPVSIQCKVARGTLTVALGPWRASGRWWEPGAWQREEWDVQTRDGQALRLVQSEGEWRVEAIVD